MKYSENLQKLFKLGRDNILSLEKLDYTKYVSEDDIAELSKMALDGELHDCEVEPKWCTPYHALNALIQFKSIEPLGEILNMLADNSDNDFLNETVIYYIRSLEDASFKDVEEALLNKSFSSDSKMTILNGLSDIAKKREDLHKQIVDMVRKTVDTQELCSGSNGFVIMVLVDAGGVENIEKIREIFKTKDVDNFVMGDLEEIEIRLGLRSDRTTALAKSDLFEGIFNSIDEDYEDTVSIKVGRNDPCPCGSGKKYKKCCL